jgi:hypothetical protein
MTGGRPPDEVFALVDAALRLPAEERAPWIEAADASPAAKDEALAVLAGVSLGFTAPGDHEQAAAPTLAGASIGDFRIVRPIGSGAGGLVYEAEQRMPVRLVALKVLRASGNRAGERVAAEAQALDAVRHPGIATVHAAGTVPSADGTGFAWIAMELVEDARNAVERAGELNGDPSAVALMLLGFADAVAAAHRAGILHRDIKPANLLVDRWGRTKVVDFGIAIAAPAGAPAAGTPAWMAPECAAGGKATPRSDVWSLGQVVRACADAAGLPRSDPLRALASMAGSADPSRRYEDAGAMRDDLERLVEGRPAHCLRRRPFARAAAVVRRRPRATAMAAGGAAAVLLSAVAAVGYRSIADASMLLDMNRMLAMHDQIAQLLDRTPPEGVEGIARVVEDRARLAMGDMAQGPDSVFLGFSSMVRLGMLDRGCALAHEGLRRLRDAGASDAALRWLAVSAAMCDAAGEGADGEELARLAELADALSARSRADDLLLGCYADTMGAASGDSRLRDVARRLDERFNPDPGASAYGTALALVAMGHESAGRLSTARLRSLRDGIERWAAWPLRDQNCGMYATRLVEAIDSMAERGDGDSVDDVVPLLRRVAAIKGDSSFGIVCEAWIARSEYALGRFASAAATLDALARTRGAEGVDPVHLLAWLPLRAEIALSSRDPAAEIDRLLAAVDAVPALGSNDPGLVRVLRAWRLGDAERAGDEFRSWSGRPGAEDTAARRRLREAVSRLVSGVAAPER